MPQRSSHPTGPLSRRHFLTATSAGLGTLVLLPSAVSSRAAADDGTGIGVRAVSAWDKVYGTADDPVGRDSWIADCGAGEHLQFQLVVDGHDPSDELRVEVRGMFGATRIRAETISMRVVGAVEVAASSHGSEPDLLEPLANGVVPDHPGDPMVVWVTIPVPANAAPGTVRGRFRVRSGERTEAFVQATLRIHGFSQPSAPSYASVAQLWPTQIDTWDPTAAANDYEAYLTNLGDHQVTGLAMINDIQVIDNGDGDLTLDTEEYDRIGERLFDEYGFSYAQFPGLNYRDPWNPVILGKARNPSRFLPGAQWNGIDIFVADDSAELTAQFRATFLAHAEAIADHLRAKGWLQHCHIVLIDELSARIPLNLARLQTIFGALKERIPDIRIRLTSCPHPELYDVVDLWVSHADYFHHGTVPEPDAPEKVAHARENGQTVWTYHNTAALQEWDLTRVRMLAWTMWNESIPGALSWWSNTNYSGTTDPWAVASDKATQRASLLLYPPRPGASDRRPLDSIRWEMYRHAREEVERLVLLERRIEAAGPQHRRWAERGRAVLGRIRDELGILPHVQPWKDQDTYQQDSAWYDAIMTEVIACLDGLPG